MPNKSNRLEQKEINMVEQVKMLMEAHKHYPTYYSLVTCSNLINELTKLYVERLQDDYKGTSYVNR
jgi:hypothetical protein